MSSLPTKLLFGRLGPVPPKNVSLQIIQHLDKFVEKAIQSLSKQEALQILELAGKDLKKSLHHVETLVHQNLSVLVKAAIVHQTLKGGSFEDHLFNYEFKPEDEWKLWLALVLGTGWILSPFFPLISFALKVLFKFIQFLLVDLPKKKDII